MKKRFIALSIIITVIGLASCSTTKSPMEIKIDKALHKQAAQAIRNGNFVLEANQLLFRRGNMVNVMDNTNFIAMHNNRVTVQTAFDNGLQGANNLGGITLEGNPGNIKFSTNNKDDFTCQWSVSGAVISARIELILYADSNQAKATVYPTFSGNQLTFIGAVFPAEESKVFKGRAL